MKTFDPNYKLLDEMYQDDYYPAFLVDKVKDELQKVIDLLESGETDTEAVQEKLDEAVCGINDLQDEFYENDSEIETVARDCIGVTVDYILKWFGIPIDMEEAIRDLHKIDSLAEKPESKEVLMVLVCNGFIDGSPETQKALLDKMEGYLNHTQSEEFQKEYGDWSVILCVTLDREPDERILALLSKCPAWAEDYGVKLEIEIGGKPVRIVES